MHVSNKYYALMNINAAIQLRLILQARAMHAETNNKKSLAHSIIEFIKAYVVLIILISFTVVIIITQYAFF